MSIKYVGEIKNNYNIDFDKSEVQILSLTSNIKFGTQNLEENTSKQIRVIINSIGDRTLSFDDNWRWVTQTPTSLLNNRVGVLELFNIGQKANDVVAYYSEVGAIPDSIPIVSYWGYEDFATITGIGLTLTKNENADVEQSDLSQIVNSSSVVVDQNGKGVYTSTILKLTSNLVSVQSQTGTSVVLSAIPQASYQPFRIWFLIKGNIPSGAVQAPKFINKQRVEFIEEAFVNQYGDTMGGILNMNGYQITNLPIPIADEEPVRKGEFENHASNHIDGTDDIQDATNAQKGLATIAQITDLETNTVHRSSDGKSHSDVVLNNTHRASDGKDHSDVILNNTYRDVEHIPLIQKASANGVATLDAGGKIPAGQLTSTVMEFKGNWNASTNTPTLIDGTGTNGDTYRASVAGSQDLGSGSQTWAIGDWVTYNGSIWQKSPGSDAVLSVSGKAGVVVLNTADTESSQIGTPTYTSLKDVINNNLSSGVISGGIITDAGGATVDISAGTGRVRHTDNIIGILSDMDWIAVAGSAIPTDATRYIGVEYNAGSPQISIRTTNTFNENSDFLLGVVVNDGDVLHIKNSPQKICSGVSNIHHRLKEVERLSRAHILGDLILTETGARNIATSSGEIYEGINEFLIAAIDTSGVGTFDRYYTDGIGGWNKELAETQWNNTQYDNSGTLTTMTDGKYSNQYFYLETDGGLVSIYGFKEYDTLDEARTEVPHAVLPDRLNVTGLYIGLLVFKKDDTIARLIESPFIDVFVLQYAGQDYKFAEGGDPYKEGTNDTTWNTAAIVPFLGTDKGLPTLFIGIVANTVGGGDGAIRIIDTSNGNVVVGEAQSGVVGTTPTPITELTLENMSADTAVWAIQFRRTTSGRARLYSISII